MVGGEQQRAKEEAAGEKEENQAVTKVTPERERGTWNHCTGCDVPASLSFP